MASDNEDGRPNPVKISAVPGQSDTQASRAQLSPQARDSAAIELRKDGSDASNDTILKSFQAFISFIVGVSIFGASTFSIVVSEIANPADHSPNPQFGRETVRTFLALSWLFFILALALGGFSMSVATSLQEKADGKISTNALGKLKRWGLLASFLLQALLIAAFLFLSLALVAYVKVVGWVAVGFSAAAGIVAACLFLWGNSADISKKED